MDRRTFARTAAAVLAGLGLPTSGRGAPATGLPANSLPERRLGRTGLQVPILALGGHHVGRSASEAEARILIETALEEGIRFFDNAESYQNGKSERWLGAALEGVRSDVLIMTKTHSPRDRSADSARRHLKEASSACAPTIWISGSFTAPVARKTWIMRSAPAGPWSTSCGRRRRASSASSA